MNVRCFLGLHDWNYCCPHDDVIRYCQRCKMQQWWDWRGSPAGWNTYSKPKVKYKIVWKPEVGKERTIGDEQC